MEKTTIPNDGPRMAIDWQGKMQVAPVVKGKVCDDRTDLDVRLVQQGRNRFAVIYGLQLRADLTYSQAATEYGSSVMHALACRGLLDNSH